MFAISVRIGDNSKLLCSCSQALANLVTQEHLAEGRVYPPLSQIREVSAAIATEVAENVYRDGMASAYPEPANKAAYIQSFVYNTEYESFEPATWDWPEN